jgi:HlyD family secretion protein
MSTSSSSPAPNPGGPKITPNPPAPGPAIVPPREPARPKRAIWAVVLALVGIAGVAAYYFSQSAKLADGGGGVMSVPTTTVSLGAVHTTIRINGTIAAQTFAALVAPRIMGSRTGINRGGDGGSMAGGRGGAGGGGGGGAMMSGGGGGGGGRDMGGGGGPMNDFSLVLLHLASPGARVNVGDEVAQFDPQLQKERLDDYRDSLVTQENNVRKQLANLVSQREAQEQQLRSTKAEWDRSLLDVKAAEVKSEIDREKNRLSAEEAELRYRQLLKQLDLVDESQRAQVRATELTRESSRMEFERSQNNVSKMAIKSPIQGIVVMQSIVRNGEFGQIREGDQVSAGQPFMQIVDPGSMVLNGTVNQVDAEKLRLGMKATVRLDAYPDIELPGVLEGIGAMAKISTFRAGYVSLIPVRVKILKTDARVIPDLTGSGEVILDSLLDTLVAPRQAVFQETDGNYVFVKGAEGWARKKVDLGLSSFTAVGVRSGLQKGDVIALRRPL